MKYFLIVAFFLCAGCLAVPNKGSAEPENDMQETGASEPVAVENDVDSVSPAPDSVDDVVVPEDSDVSVVPEKVPEPVGPSQKPADPGSPVRNQGPMDLNGEPIVLPTMMIDEFTVNKDMRLGTVLRALARIANINIAFGDSVENLGPFRFRLNNPTPWNEVMESILGVYHLSYEVRGKIITVMTLADMNQRYSLEKQKSDQLDLKLRRESMSPLVLRVINIKYGQAAALVEPLSKMLKQSAGEDGGAVRGSISADESSNSIVLNAPESDIVKLKSLIDLIDRQTRQIRIEATLVEVSTSLARELGVAWSFSGSDSDNNSTATGSPMSMDSEEGAFTLSDATYNSMQGLVDTAEGTIDYGIIGSDFALGMNLNALAEDGKLKILSRPSLTTMDNRKAVIKSGQDIPFQTEDEDGRSVVEYKEAVLSLNVLPHIVDDVAIFMDVAITKDEPDFSQAVDGNPVVIKKYVESRMMVLNGQTAVIAGLTKSSQFDSDGGIPFLRKIPFLGWLAATKSKENSEEELMIFLTPRIIPTTALDNRAIIEDWMSRNYYDKEDDSADIVSAMMMTTPAAGSSSAATQSATGEKLQ